MTDGVADDRERGSAVVDFAVVSVFVVVLLLVVLQVAVYVHWRNVVTSSAQDLAGYAARADIPAAAGARRTLHIVARATKPATAAGVSAVAGCEMTALTALPAG